MANDKYMEFNDYYVKRINGYLRGLEDRYRRSGLYSMRLKTMEYISYIGLSDNFREKFCDGYHKNIWNFVDLYVIASAYKKQRDNFENFSAIVDDCKSVWLRDNKMINDFLFKSGISLINNIVSNKNYKNMPNLRRCLDSLLHSLDSPNKFKLYEKISEEVEKLRIDYLYSNYDCESFNKVLDFRVGMLLDGEDLDFYNRFLVDNNRYFYINNRLKEVESNPKIRKMIFDVFDSCGNIFELLNESSNKDYFIKTMDIILDSDSYYELFDKLRLLLDAGNYYKELKREDAFRIVKDLDILANKRVYCSKIVSYPKNCINLVNKPKTILEREKALCFELDNSISYEFMDFLHDSFSNVEDMYKVFDDCVEQEKSVFVKVKRKFSFFNKKKC